MSSVENPGQGSRFPADSPSGIFRIPASFRAAASGRLFDPVELETEAESITVRIRWFGLGIGYLYVNFGTQVGSPRELNAMLTLGAAYALIDTLASWKGRLLLTNYRMAISLMEALFIGLLCHRRRCDQSVSILLFSVSDGVCDPAFLIRDIHDFRSAFDQLSAAGVIQ